MYTITEYILRTTHLYALISVHRVHPGVPGAFTAHYYVDNVTKIITHSHPIAELYFKNLLPRLCYYNIFKKNTTEQIKYLHLNL